MLLTKNGKLVALNESDQKMIFDLYCQGGTIIKYHYSCLYDLPTLLIINDQGKEIGSLAGQTALTVDKLVHLSSKYYPEGMNLSDFIKQYCPVYAGK